MSAMDVVRTQELVKVYKAGKVPVPAVNGVDLSVAEGDFVAIMGPSGCGKSSLLHMLGALDTPTSGRIFIDDVELGRLGRAGRTRLRREKIGFVFQRFNLIPGLTALENLKLACTIKARQNGNPPDPEELLSIVGLEDKAKRRPMELSFGEQQRVAIARALLYRPRLLLADEPTGSLDSHAAENILNLFARVNSKFDQTIVMITHSEEAATYAHRVLRMRDGKMVE